MLQEKKKVALGEDGEPLDADDAGAAPAAAGEPERLAPAAGEPERAEPAAGELEHAAAEPEAPVVVPRLTKLLKRQQELKTEHAPAKKSKGGSTLPVLRLESPEFGLCKTYRGPEKAYIQRWDEDGARWSSVVNFSGGLTGKKHNQCLMLVWRELSKEGFDAHEVDKVKNWCLNNHALVPAQDENLFQVREWDITAKG